MFKPFSTLLVVELPALSLPPLSDKAVLPASVLEQLLEASSELPTPLIFQISTALGETTFIGTREFTAAEGAIHLPRIIQEKLGAEAGSEVTLTLSSEKSVPKGTRLVVKPLDADYPVSNWKYFLESRLNNAYTTLTQGDVLVVGSGKQTRLLEGQLVEEEYRLLVDTVEPALTVCIVDTDVSLEIVPLNDDNAQKMLDKGLEVSEIAIKLDEVVPITDSVKYQFDVSEYVASRPQEILQISIASELKEGPGLVVSVDEFVSPNTFIWSNMETKQIRIPLADSLLMNHRSVFITQYSPSPEKALATFSVSIFPDTDTGSEEIPAGCQCNESFTEYFSLARHKAVECAEKLHECQFCRLLLPQGLATPQDKLQGLTHHESDCGNKTTDCYKCHQPIKQKDFASHLKIHDMNRIAKPKPVKCHNVNCIHTRSVNEYALCDICFGPSYSSVYDPDYTKLKSRFERRYMIQATRGCGSSWCKNLECVSSGLKSRDPISNVLGHIQNDLLTQIPFIPGGVRSQQDAWFAFCVDETATRKKFMVDLILEEHQYETEWICEAVKHRGIGSGGAEDVASIKGWLSENAIKIEEQKSG
ncbi:hypothetical protein BABINDRAFT_8789 [Babjeviella inositovora NRRL Y-12698]|uniref:Ubiquitin-protein ligase E3A N-terminal zinc-binding domain-containing protein n=1 Tax=Babjeviella inositovora NRRL Y-12698 TaxID=984486 RepID=A0A1E3QNE4_9ASCO|nr:uncharacterized protein BABINDRAFT_8789 [Babjeviella inositovora NRRL Y-12698]ODQ79205.1 hypothetical protein BABINDRAFT_8789 [Babjeviella inositovora NRRL Y-12698]